jgi:hypothetical protein
MIRKESPSVIADLGDTGRHGCALGIVRVKVVASTPVTDSDKKTFTTSS